MINDLNYEGIKFPVSKKDYFKTERQNNICISMFCYENNLAYPVYLSDQKFHNSMDLLLISDENKSHYVYIKDFNRFMCNKTKTKNKKYFSKFKNCFKQLLVPFKIYADFECLLKGVKSSDKNNGIDMHLFTEKGMRGGISYIVKRHSKANNKYMECHYSRKESICITYHDANNLYGLAMSSYS